MSVFSNYFFRVYSEKFAILVSILLLSLLFHRCTNFIASEPITFFYKQNVLLPTVKFETTDSTIVHVEYWPSGFPNSVQKSAVSNGTSHTIILVNVTQSTKYEYVIRQVGNNGKSSVYGFKTGQVPESVFKTNKEVIDTTQFKGYVLIRRLSNGAADAILNKEGEIVWYHLYDTLVRRAFTWTGHQSILSVYDSSHIVDYDLYGNLILDLKLENHNIPNKVHHEVIYNDKQEIVSLTLDSTKMDLRKFGGKENQNLRGDGILVVTKEGEKRWEWNILQKVNPNIYNPVPFSLRDSWGHANSFFIDKDGHYVVSFKGFDQIWKINSIDGEILWKLGKGGDFAMDESSFFIGQHSVYRNRFGEIMMFDNGSRSRPNSRVLSFVLDEKKMIAETKINVVLPIELSAYRMCSAELIDKGKYLVCTTKKDGVLAVVDDKAEVLWKVVLDNSSYRAYYLANPFQQ